MLDTTASDQVTEFLDAFGAALEAGDIDRATEMFAEDCYWRDLVAFTWNIKTVEGRDEVADMLRHQLESTAPSGWRIAEGEVAAEEGGVTTAWISFETGVGPRLRADPAARRPDLDAADLARRTQGFRGAAWLRPAARCEAWCCEAPAELEGGARGGGPRTGLHPSAPHADRRRRTGRHRARRTAAAARRADDHRREERPPRRQLA